MMEEEYKKVRRAYEKYNEDGEYKKEEKAVKKIIERIEENKEEIKELIKIRKEKESYEKIKEAIEEEVKRKSEYKKEVNIIKREDGFVRGKYQTSIGVIGVESYEIIPSIRYMIRGIRNRNGIIISDIEYEEKDVKHLIQEIIRGVLKEEGIDENIIEIIPYEECEYERLDKVITTYESKNKREKEKSQKLYIYIEDKELEEEARREYEKERSKKEEVEIVEGKMEEAVEKINEKESKGAVIYTKDAKKGYKFINIVRSRNVYVNATLENVIDKIEESKDEMLMTKNIMYELKI